MYIGNDGAYTTYSADNLRGFLTDWGPSQVTHGEFQISRGGYKSSGRLVLGDHAGLDGGTTSNLYNTVGVLTTDNNMNIIGATLSMGNTAAFSLIKRGGTNIYYGLALTGGSGPARVDANSGSFIELWGNTTIADVYGGRLDIAAYGGGGTEDNGDWVNNQFGRKRPTYI